MYSKSPFFNTDSYKLSHHGFSPAGLEEVYSNFTPRNSHYFKERFPDFDDKYVQFGIQGVFKDINDIFNNEFFSRPKKDQINILKSVFGPYLGMQDFTIFEELHDLGYLPIEVRAIEEGKLVPIGVPALTIHNTHPKFAWLTNYLETWISNELWKPMTVATIAREFRKLSQWYSDQTCDNDLHIKFQNHDFSCRGQSGMNSSAACGAAWLTQSIGTDNTGAIPYAYGYYNGSDSNVIALSIPASEHSVATLGILSSDPEDKLLGETKFLKRVLEEYYPSGLVSYVSDSYDYWGLITQVLPELAENVMLRDGKLVIRPDSGDPVRIVAGYNIYNSDEVDAYTGFPNLISLMKEGYNFEVIEIGNEYLQFTFDGKNIHLGEEIPSHVAHGTISELWDIFGGSVNSKGYKVLDDHIGLIYGDGITYDRALNILDILKSKGFASSNVVFGIGSFTLGMLSRDDLGSAIKATKAIVDGEEISLFKQPKTDSAKNSAKGYLFVGEKDGDMYLENDVPKEKMLSEKNCLKPVFKDGKFLNEISLEQIRRNLNFQISF